MRMVTFQDKYVIELIQYKKENNNIPIYECNISNYSEKEEKLHSMLFSEMRKRLNIPDDKMISPVWCWGVRKTEELTDEFLNELYNRFTPKCDRMVCIELDVPKDYIFITNFEVWYDLLFKCKFNQQINTEDFNKLFEKQKNVITQICIPFIHDDFIVSVKDYEDYLNHDYSQTDSEIELLHKRGEFING